MKNKQKIIRVSTVPQSLNNFLRGFLKELSSEYEVIALSSPGDSLKEVQQREDVRIIEVPMERHISIFKDIISLFKLIVVFARERPDIVHSMTPKAGLLSMLAACITRVPVRIHTFTGLVFPTSLGLKRKILMCMDSLTCTCSTFINPESRGVANDLRRFGITKKPLHIIANGNVRGIDLHYYARTEEIVQLAKLLHVENSFTFCFVGRLVRDKGINELVLAFDRLSKENHKVRLLLIGPYEREIDALDVKIERIIQTNQRIITFGKQKEIRHFLVSSDAFVLPSYREGMPNVVLEAGAMGLPSIVTDINGSNEIIINGKNGEIIPPKDEDALYKKMKEWVNNTDKVRVMAENSRKLVAERYEQKMIWNALLREYRNLLKY